MITLAIITYRRPQQLETALSSINHQSQQPVEIIVVDNDPNTHNQSLCHKYGHKTKVTYLPCSLNNISVARNLSITHSSTDWLGFIDDDCKLLPDWMDTALHTISHLKQQNITVVMGSSLMKHPENLCERALHNQHARWLSNFIEPDSKFIKNLEILDTKNCLIHLDKVRHLNLKFDPRFHTESGYSNEDADFGLQLQNHGLKGLYNSDLKVKHSGPKTFRQLIRKGYMRGRLRYIYSQKWQLCNIWQGRYDLRLFKQPGSNLKAVYRKLKWILTTAQKQKPGNRNEFLAYQANELAFNQGFQDALSQVAGPRIDLNYFQKNNHQFFF